jgi:hypothetical protein
MLELVRRLHDTRAFLQMAVIELRRLAEQAPALAARLRHIAQQLETEVQGLTGRGEEGGQCSTSSK